MHERFPSLMSLVLDGVATPREVQELEQHLGTCKACWTMWQRLEVVDRMLSTSPVAVPASDLATTVGQRLGQIERRGRRPCSLAAALILWGMCLAGSCIAVLGLFSWVWRYPLEAALVVSSVARVLSAASGLLGGVPALVAVTGPPILSTACGLLSGGLVLLWGWRWMRSRNGGGRPENLANLS